MISAGWRGGMCNTWLDVLVQCVAIMSKHAPVFAAYARGMVRGSESPFNTS